MLTRDELAKIIFGHFEAIHPEVYYGTVQDHADAAAEALLAAQQAAWQPIETAPKDGTWVLLFVPPEGYARSGRVYVATWEPIGYNNEPQWAFGPNGFEHSFRSGVYGATHWMPLPAPPRT